MVQAVQAEKAEKPPSTGQAWALQLRDLVPEPTAPGAESRAFVQLGTPFPAATFCALFWCGPMRPASVCGPGGHAASAQQLARKARAQTRALAYCRPGSGTGNARHSTAHASVQLSRARTRATVRCPGCTWRWQRTGVRTAVGANQGNHTCMTWYLHQLCRTHLCFPASCCRPARSRAPC